LGIPEFTESIQLVAAPQFRLDIFDDFISRTSVTPIISIPQMVEK
jgi:hypothetical protein